MNELQRSAHASQFAREKRRQQRNQPRPPRGVSGYRGVSPCGKRWRAQHRVGVNTHYLGCYDTAELAALAFDEAEANAGKTLEADYNFPFLR